VEEKKSVNLCKICGRFYKGSCAYYGFFKDGETKCDGFRAKAPTKEEVIEEPVEEPVEEEEQE